MKEFTISFWAKADLLSTETYLLNMFHRIFIKVESSKVKFIFERSSGDLIEPTYIGTKNQITTGEWFYVSVSQKEHKDAGIHHITQKLVISTAKVNQAEEAGSKTDHSTVTYHKFVNSIFIGGYNYTNPFSFTGYIKEVKLFQQFHGSPQMINDRLRLHKVHSFEDENLIAYWKLSEKYTSADLVQTIHDYSKHNIEKELSVSFSPLTNKDYPSFIYSQGNSLKLCFYHDVAICKTVKNIPQILSNGRRITRSDSFSPQSSSHTIVAGDKIYFKLGGCVTGVDMAIITYSVSGFWQADSNFAPEILDDGSYYSV